MWCLRSKPKVRPSSELPGRADTSIIPPWGDAGRKIDKLRPLYNEAIEEWMENYGPEKTVVADMEACPLSDSMVYNRASVGLTGFVMGLLTGWVCAGGAS